MTYPEGYLRSTATQIHPCVWEVPITARDEMIVPAHILASDKLFQAMDEGVFLQVTNLATMPGIVQKSICMPDGHWGYGFPIGGVAAIDPETGVISPGGIGFDINCGMRLIGTKIKEPELLPKLSKLMDNLSRMIPSGIGGGGGISLGGKDQEEICLQGARWCLNHGLAWSEDLRFTEGGGELLGADPSLCSQKSYDRSRGQLGTLGSGNHYLEVQTIREENIADPVAAAIMDLEPGTICIMVHCGSRGFGHQIATDYLKEFSRGFKGPDRNLAWAPFKSKEGQEYFAAMTCAANWAFANRQVITHRIREAFKKTFDTKPEFLGMNVIYDVAHNIAKLEQHGGQTLLVHRKGATRAFPPGHPEIPREYAEIGQPVIVGGSMETGSYLFLGTDLAMKHTFGSTLHGSGRTMSRSKAKAMTTGAEVKERMNRAGIDIRTPSVQGLAEESAAAYKDIDEVARTVTALGISRPVARVIPLGNVKG